MLSTRYILIIVLFVSIAVFAASVYGVGTNQNDKTSSAYQAAFTFTMVGLASTVISIIGLFFVLNGESCSISDDLLKTAKKISNVSILPSNTTPQTS